MDIHKKFFSKIGFNYLIFGLVSLIIQIIVINIIGGVNHNILSDINILAIISSICNYILPFPLFFYLMRKIEKQNLEKQALSLKKFLLYLAITFTLMWIGNLVGVAVTSLIGNLFQIDISNPVEYLINSSDIWLNLLLISIIGPIFEEIFFRKFLIDRTIKYGARVSIILSAVIFGFFHGNISQLFYAFLLGGFFAYVYIKTGKIIYTIALHIIVNLMGSVVSLFVSESVNALTANTYGTIDLLIIILYFLIIVSALFAGILSLLMFRKGKFNGSKTQIALKHPLRTSLLNPGMICFILFYILIIVYTLI
ncbi:CPBP family intramembrane glutamic endopeptidase [Methanobrevibacter sp.]|uniref:CPBP family intramembrane glutamic endopeptidase n=1 Tax=Methanobrevibacter sp. TaxID=66852 RepID=UPI0038675A4F